MAIKQKNSFSEAIQNRMAQNREQEENPKTESVSAKSSKSNSKVTVDVSEQEAQIRLRIEKELKKKLRTQQRSCKLEDHIINWLDNVKKHQKEQLGITRPCLDDLMHDAIEEYLKNHYEELEPSK